MPPDRAPSTTRLYDAGMGRVMDERAVKSSTMPARKDFSSSERLTLGFSSPALWADICIWAELPGAAMLRRGAKVAWSPCLEAMFTIVWRVWITASAAARGSRGPVAISYCMECDIMNSVQNQSKRRND